MPLINSKRLSERNENTLRGYFKTQIYFKLCDADTVLIEAPNAEEEIIDISRRVGGRLAAL